MAAEQARACGYRKVGKTYLVGAWAPEPCDRLPFWLNRCPGCGAGVAQSRGWTAVLPLDYFGVHQDCTCKSGCFVCMPPNGKHGILWVGGRYYKKPEDFTAEAARQGISKAIAQIPHWLEVGKSVVYLAHPKTGRVVPMKDGLPGFTEEQRKPGIFLAWRPQRIERLYWESQRDSEQVKADEKRGITAVFIPSGDQDHVRK